MRDKSNEAEAEYGQDASCLAGWNYFQADLTGIKGIERSGIGVTEYRG